MALFELGRTQKRAEGDAPNREVVEPVFISELPADMQAYYRERDELLGIPRWYVVAGDTIVAHLLARLLAARAPE